MQPDEQLTSRRSRRLRRVRVSAICLEDFLCARFAGVISDAPADLRIVQLRQDPESFQRNIEPVLDLIVESESFTEVAAGFVIPEIMITFKTLPCADNQPRVVLDEISREFGRLAALATGGYQPEHGRLDPSDPPGGERGA